MKELNKLLRIQMKLSIIYYSQIDGQTEDQLETRTIPEGFHQLQIGAMASMKVTRAKLPDKSSENRIRLLEGYSTLYIQVPLAMEYPKGQGQECRSRQLINVM